MDNGIKTNTILAGILGFGLVVFGALAILFLVQKQSGQSLQNTPQEEQSLSQTPQDTSPTLPPFEQAIDNNVISSLSKIKKGILSKSILTNTYSGEVVKVSTAGGYVPTANNFKFKIMLVIKNAQGEQNTFYYNDRDASLLQNSVDSLKPGDTITITETIDLQKPQTENMVQLTIEK